MTVWSQLRLEPDKVNWKIARWWKNGITHPSAETCKKWVFLTRRRLYFLHCLLSLTNGASSSLLTLVSGYHIPHAGLLVLLIFFHYSTLPGCSDLHTSLLTAALPLHNWQGFSPPSATHSVHKKQPCMAAIESLSQRLWLFFFSTTWEIAIWSFHIYNKPSFCLWNGLVQ